MNLAPFMKSLQKPKGGDTAKLGGSSAPGLNGNMLGTLSSLNYSDGKKAVTPAPPTSGYKPTTYGDGKSKTTPVPQAPSVAPDACVDTEAMYDELGFDPGGPTELEFVKKNPIDSIGGYISKEATEGATEREFPTNEVKHNDDADAFRHAYFSYTLAGLVGSDTAKEIGDAHEISAPNPSGERLMDLYNNSVGRDLNDDPDSKWKLPSEVIQDALSEGKLKTSPFKTKDTGCQ